MFVTCTLRAGGAVPSREGDEHRVYYCGQLGGARCAGARMPARTEVRPHGPGPARAAARSQKPKPGAPARDCTRGQSHGAGE